MRGGLASGGCRGWRLTGRVRVGVACVSGLAGQTAPQPTRLRESAGAALWPAREAAAGDARGRGAAQQGRVRLAAAAVSEAEGVAATSRLPQRQPAAPHAPRASRAARRAARAAGRGGASRDGGLPVLTLASPKGYRPRPVSAGRRCARGAHAAYPQAPRRARRGVQAPLRGGLGRRRRKRLSRLTADSAAPPPLPLPPPHTPGAHPACRSGRTGRRTCRRPRRRARGPAAGGSGAQPQPRTPRRRPAQPPPRRSTRTAPATPTGTPPRRSARASRRPAPPPGAAARPTSPRPPPSPAGARPRRTRPSARTATAALRRRTPWARLGAGLTARPGAAGTASEQRFVFLSFVQFGLPCGLSSPHRAR